MALVFAVAALGCDESDDPPDPPEGVRGGAGGSGATTTGGGGGASGSSAAGGTSAAGSGGTQAVCADLSPPGAATSCTELDPTCGPNGDADCCASSVIPGGSFSRSNDERYPATVCDFRLDLYEVTVGRFRKFIEAFDAGWRPESGSGKNLNDHSPASEGWVWELPEDVEALFAEPCRGAFPTWTESPGDNESRPMNCLSWPVANAFCIWDGGRLPTEAEWNYAAAGGDEQRFYPWSDPPESETLDPMHASYREGDDCVGDGMPGCGLDDILPVGSRPMGDGRWGQADMGGNLGEYVFDQVECVECTGGDYTFPYGNPCWNCANHYAPQSGSRLRGNVQRGGAYLFFEIVLRTATRTYGNGEGYDDIGVRCVRNP